MAKEKDYRNTRYCPLLKNIEKQKQCLEEEIKSTSPRTKIIYNKVSDRKSVYHKKFAEIYNEKCAYCGALWGLLPVESFEVDHFLNEASFPDTTEGKAEAGDMMNLVNTLRLNGFNVDMDFNNRNIKNNFKHADKLEAKFVILIGKDEVNNKIVTIKNNESLEEFKVKLENIVEFLDEKLSEE